MPIRNQIRYAAHPVLSKGGDVFGSPVDITNAVSSASTLKYSIDKSDWEAGIVNIPNMRLGLYNRDGLLDDGISPNPESVFKAGRNKSKIIVSLLGNTVFDGDILDLDTFETPFDDRLNLTVSSPINRLRQKVVESGDISERSSVADALIGLCENVPTISKVTFNGQLGKLEPFLSINEHFLNRPTWDVVKEITELTGNITLIGDNREISFYPSFASEAFRPADPITITDPINVKITSGIKRIINTVLIDFNGGRIVQANRASIAEYGERKKEFEALWVKDRQAAERLALNLVSAENSTPRRILDIETVLSNDILARLALLNRVEVVVPEQYKGIPHGGDLPVNENYSNVKRRGVEARGRIIAYVVNLKDLKVNIKIEESEWV